MIVPKHCLLDMQKKIRDFENYKILKDFHTFMRKERWFSFYPKTNQLFEISKEEADILIRYQDILNGESQIRYCTDISAFSFFDELISSLNIVDEEKIGLLPLESFYLQFNTDCNLTCKYCNIKKNNDLSEICLNVDTAVNAVKKLKLFGAKGVGIHGGEPLLKFGRLKAIIEAIHALDPNFQIGLTTNGTLVSAGIAKFLKKHKVFVSVELDGNQENHDRNKKYLTGQGSYNTTLKGIEKLAHVDVLSAIECTVDSFCEYTLKELFESFKEFQKIPITISRVKNSCETSSVGVHQGIKLKRFLSEIRQLSFDETYNHIFTDTKAHLINLSTREPINTNYVCSCLLNKVSVSANGDVYPCPKVSGEKFLIGNVNDETFVKTFTVNRQQKSTHFEKKNYKRYWYDNLMEICIDSVFLSKEKRYQLIDEKVVEEYFEDLLFDFVAADMGSLCDMWGIYGF